MTGIQGVIALKRIGHQPVILSWYQPLPHSACISESNSSFL